MDDFELAEALGLIRRVWDPHIRDWRVFLTEKGERFARTQQSAA